MKREELVKAKNEADKAWREAYEARDEAYNKARREADKAREEAYCKARDEALKAWDEADNARRKAYEALKQFDKENEK